MSPTDPFSRRKLLALVGLTTTAAIAGCADGGPGEEAPDDEETDAGEDDAAETEDGGNDEETDAADENGGNGDAIEGGTTILLDAQTEGWEGVEPDEIADETNPTLVLEDGADYELGWEEGDGAIHNIEIWNEDDEVVDDLETEQTDEANDDQFLVFTASEEMVRYVCQPHQTTMIGDIEVE